MLRVALQGAPPALKQLSGSRDPPLMIWINEVWTGAVFVLRIMATIAVHLTQRLGVGVSGVNLVTHILEIRSQLCRHRNWSEDPSPSFFRSNESSIFQDRQDWDALGIPTFARLQSQNLLFSTIRFSHRVIYNFSVNLMDFAKIHWSFTTIGDSSSKFGRNSAGIAGNPRRLSEASTFRRNSQKSWRNIAIRELYHV